MKAIRERRSEDAAEVSIGDRPIIDRFVEEVEVGPTIVANGVFVVVARAQESVAGAVVELNASAVEAVIRIRMTAALKVGSERRRAMPDAVVVGEPLAFLLSVCAGCPTEHVIERPVLHHHDDDVLDPGFLWATGERKIECALRLGHPKGARQSVGASERVHARGDRGASQQPAARWILRLVSSGDSGLYRSR